jgi:surface polysaccharide O-acyltransferase-like enzyme
MTSANVTTINAHVSRRISGLDTARALAIFLAVCSHSFIHFGVWPLLDSDLALLLHLFTRSATPVFIILFGMMLELVYLKRLLAGKRTDCWRRLVSRAIQCYSLFLCVVVAGVAGGKLSPNEGIRAAVFLSEAYFANILTFYSVGLLAGILLLELRARFGLRVVAYACAVIWISYPFVKAVPDVPGSMGYLASLLVGVGAQTGPSVWQGMSLVAFGMFLGRATEALLSSERSERKQALLLLGAIVVFISTVLAMSAMQDGLRPLLKGFADFSYRAANHPNYYLLGSLLAIGLIGGSIAAASVLPPVVVSRLNVFGISSLFAYAFGNVVLNLLPPLAGNLSLGLLSSAVFLIGLYAATAYFIDATTADATTGRGGPLALRLGLVHERVQRVTVRLAEVCVARLSL